MSFKVEDNVAKVNKTKPGPTTCEECGSVVMSDQQGAHDKWHAHTKTLHLGMTDASKVPVPERGET